MKHIFPLFAAFVFAAAFSFAEEIDPADYPNCIDADMDSFELARTAKIDARDTKKVLGGSHTYGDYRANANARYYDFSCFDQELGDPGRWLGWPPNGGYAFPASNPVEGSGLERNQTITTSAGKAWVVYNFGKPTLVNALRVTTEQWNAWRNDPQDFVLEGTNDNCLDADGELSEALIESAQWTTIVSEVGVAFEQTPLTVNDSAVFANKNFSTPFQFVRFRVTKVRGDDPAFGAAATSTALAELSYYAIPAADGLNAEPFAPEAGLTRYVSNVIGFDEYDGVSAEFPKRTIGAALSALSASMAAIDVAAPEGTPPTRGTIVLLPGTHTPSAAISIPANVTFRGFDAENPESVILSRRTGADYLLHIDGAEVVIANLCISNSTVGAIYASEAGGIVSNCVVRNNKSNSNTVTTMIYCNAAATLRDCRIINNFVTSTDGFATYGAIRLMNGHSRVENCVITNNIASWGSPSYGCAMYIKTHSPIIRNCLIAYNHFNSTVTTKTCCGAVYIAGGSPTFENCTITANDSPSSTKLNDPAMGNSGVYLAGGNATLRNCIIWGNTKLGSAANGWNLGATTPANLTLENCCYSTDNEVFASYVDGANVTDCIHTAPSFIDAENGFFGLKPCECVDAGISAEWMDGAKDLGGNERILGASVDIGCYEYAVDQLECSFAVVGAGAAIGDLEAQFKASVAAPAASLEGLSFFWDFGDGTTQSGADLAEVSHTYTSRGLFDVTLRVENSLGESAEIIHEALVRSVPQTIYISRTSEPSIPYDSPENAAGSLAGALDFALDGCTILVDRGVWGRNENVRIAVTKAVEIKSIYGAAETIVSNTFPLLVSQQTLRLEHPGAIVDGITFLGSIAQYNETAGGAIYITSGGSVRNCIFEKCRCYSNGNGNVSRGGAIGVNNGLIENCIFRECDIGVDKNSRSTGFAIYATGSTQIRNCLFLDCFASTSGERSFAGTIATAGSEDVLIENCTVMNNSNSCYGNGWVYNGNAGIYAGTTGKTIVRNCIVRGNLDSNGAEFNFSRAAGTLIVSNCCINAEELATNLSGANIIVGGCITSDPLLKGAALAGSPAADYQLRTKSPCRNAGLLLDWMTEDGFDVTSALKRDKPNLRILFAAPDIGAFETPFMPPTYITVR